ncbi:MAG TPA: GAF domain-containing SpoIIE family protein phosphatase, partial [Aquihabitans sp.]|nr:GAF domain-containing SpoIIE family protein phosphatase [Aquihabitans sp.]
HPRNTAIFAPTFEGEGVLRLHDVTADSRYGRNDPHFGMPEGHLPVRSYLAVPVISGTKEVLGGLFLGHAEPGRFDQRAERLVTGIAQHAASALDAVRLFEGEHRLALQLQRTLLPRTLPPIPGLEIAARYQPASELAEVGGDWYDVTRLPDGTVSITVGDVAGHDLRAASTMGRLRHALQLYALDGFRPVEALERVDRLMARAGIAETATALHGILDPESGTLELCRAGHPSPLILRADGTREWPEPTRYGGPLLGGSTGSEPRTTLVVHLEPGDAVVLFTDGLVERPQELLDDGIARLVAAAAGCQGRSAADTCDLLIEELVGTENRDDVVVLAVKVV